MSNTITSTIDLATLATVSGGFVPINTILDHKPGTDWGKVGQAAHKGAESVGVASSAAAFIPGTAGKLVSGALLAGGAYYGGANEYLAQQKKLK